MSKFRIQFFTSPQSQGHSYFISNKARKLFSFGFNDRGQLSLEDKYIHRNKPTSVNFFNRQKIKIKKIACGRSCSLILSNENEVYAVGYNKYGQLSLGHKINRPTPSMISCFGNKRNIKNIFCGWYHNCFIIENGLVFSSGWNQLGQIGIGNKVNQLVAARMKIKEKIINVECGASCSLLINNVGKLFKTGQIFEEKECFIPTLIEGNLKNEKITKISCGFTTCLILCESKKLFGIGDNKYTNNLTKNFPSSSIVPIEIKGFKDIIDIRCGEHFSIFLDKNGNCFGAGNNDYLGCSKSSFNSSGVTLLKKNIIQIELGNNQTFLFDKYKELWVGGYNKYGELGLGHSKKQFELLQKNKLVKCEVKFIIPNTIIIERILLWDVIIKCKYIMK